MRREKGTRQLVPPACLQVEYMSRLQDRALVSRESHSQNHTDLPLPPGWAFKLVKTVFKPDTVGCAVCPNPACQDSRSYRWESETERTPKMPRSVSRKLGAPCR